MANTGRIEAETPAAPRASGTVDRLTDLLIRFRWLFVIPIVLPVSKLFEMWLRLRGFWIRRLRRAPERHEARVREIARQILRWRANGNRGRLCTARPWWMAVSMRKVNYKRPENSIRIALYDILSLDTDRRIVRVEPLVSIGQLTAYLFPRGWTVAVVPELNDLTVGGLFLGYGVEVSSHKYGLFCDLVRSCDVLLGDGRTVRASREENTDLFHALPWSHGSLGFVVALELEIIPARAYVHVTYHPTRGIRETCARLERETRRRDVAEFVEGFLFSQQEGIVTTGVFADVAEPGKVHYAHRWYAPWFALRCRRFITAGGGDEYIPLKHYYQRHVRGMYWESGLLVPFGDHPAFRYLLGWLMPPKISFLRLTQGDRLKRYYDEKHVIQDALVPLENLEKALRYFDRLFEVYPLWLCPMRLNRKEPAGFVNPGPGKGDHEMYIDLAVVSVPGPVLRGEPYNALDALREMESFLIENRGYQALYAVTQMSRADFRRMFDCTLYDEVRQRYGSDVFMDVYDKVRLPGAEPEARSA
jgi:delta24-sterol reductase